MKLIEPPMAVSVARCLKTWSQHGYQHGSWMPFGPMGFTVSVGHAAPDVKIGNIFVTQDELDGDEWVHASLAWRDQDPSYAELKILHESVFTTKRVAYQVFATAENHVNFHEHALHLWGRADGKDVLPQVGTEGMI